MWTCHALGDRCLTWRCADVISPEASRRVLAVYQALKETPIPGVLDVVPAYTELAVHFDPCLIPQASLQQAVQERLDACSASTSSMAAGEPHMIPVVYDGEDLERISAHTGLGIEEVILRHAAGRYTVAMVGFLPHFPYCLGLDPALHTPRLSSPRERVPAGSVALAGGQTGVYPRVSPGGWNLLGHTDPSLLEVIVPGDLIQFTPVEARA